MDSSEEMAEIMISFGAEYWYKELFAARTGYFYEAESKGGRQYFTLGVGFRYQKFGIDFSYLIPTEQNNPLAETIRFSLLFNFDKEENKEDLN
ncbi:PorV/PorQ family protein [Reichenbachiella agarivorans]|uniref:PorV/PorQ family protein n=1 Tax=Reichenbachiella agarivorans TaxID=2979464 RepID=UPI0029165A16|nr:PorV/PorQ family protein [Reichenbachiella agarivorans]